MDYIDLVKNEVQKLVPEVGNFSVEIPELVHGDLTTNICLVASKVLKISPQQVYEKIEQELKNNLSGAVEKLEFVNPGFINFYFKPEFVREHLCFSAKNNLGGGKVSSEKYDGKKVLVEFTSINLFKPFNIGHLMSNFTGEFISRSLESVGAKVVRISYPSDKSIGIAKAIWSIKKDGGLDQEIFTKSLGEVVKYLGQSYITGVAEYKKFEENKDEEKIQEVKSISNNIFGDIPGVDLDIFNYTKEKNIEYFQKFLEKMDSKFDGFIYESEAGIVGKEIVLENMPGIFQESEGAIIYTPSEERKDINTSVFINSEGNPTYLAKDIGLLDLKFKKYSPLDFSIYVVDNEQNQHFKSVFDAGGKIKKEWEEKSVHVSHGRMTFKGKKMSSRLGGVPNAEEVIDAVVEDVKERSGGKETDFEVAMSALRISILRSKPGVNIDFDPEKASSFEGDSGPYLCYTHARCCSLLVKGDELKLNSSPENIKGEVSKIERKVLQFEYILKTSAEEIAPQKLVKYLFEVAGEFNSFYATEKIISDDVEKTKYNLYLTKLVVETLGKGLHILGIKAPEEM